MNKHHDPAALLYPTGQLATTALLATADPKLPRLAGD
jgi:hypothetical protein